MRVDTVNCEMGMYSVQLMWYDTSLCGQSLCPESVARCDRVFSLQWELDGDSLGSYPEHAWLIPDSLLDPSSASDRQTRAQPVIDHCLVVLPTKELVVLCLCRAVFVLGYGVAVSYNVTIESFCL